MLASQALTIALGFEIEEALRFAPSLLSTLAQSQSQPFAVSQPFSQP